MLAGAYESANRLGGTWWSTSGSNHTHEHYIKVVNTVYTGKLTDYTTYKYTVNSHEYQDNLNYAAAKVSESLLVLLLDRSLVRLPAYPSIHPSIHLSVHLTFYHRFALPPCVQFTFDISPMSIIVSAQNIPFYHFVTSMCAIIGGIFTVLGLLDMCLFHSYDSIRKKNLLGKQI